VDGKGGKVDNTLEKDRRRRKERSRKQNEKKEKNDWHEIKKKRGITRKKRPRTDWSTTQAIIFLLLSYGSWSLG